MASVDGRHTDLVALCQFLPGPASSQVGFALGLSRAGVLGALAACSAFTLPSIALPVTYNPMRPSAVGTPRDFLMAIAGFIALVAWKCPLVVIGVVTVAAAFGVRAA